MEGVRQCRLGEFFLRDFWGTGVWWIEGVRGLTEEDPAKAILWEGGRILRGDAGTLDFGVVGSWIHGNPLAVPSMGFPMSLAWER